MTNDDFKELIKISFLTISVKTSKVNGFYVYSRIRDKKGLAYSPFVLNLHCHLRVHTLALFSLQISSPHAAVYSYRFTLITFYKSKRYTMLTSRMTYRN